MVELPSRGALRDPRRAGDDHDRRAFGIGAGDRIHEIERPGAPGRDGNGDGRVEPCRRIGRETDRRFVAERVERQRAAFLDQLEERQDEVAGNAKDFLSALIAQSVKQGTAKCGHGRSLKTIWLQLGQLARENGAVDRPAGATEVARVSCATRAIRSSIRDRNSFSIGDLFAFW